MGTLVIVLPGVIWIDFAESFFQEAKGFGSADGWPASGRPPEAARCGVVELDGLQLFVGPPKDRGGIVNAPSAGGEAPMGGQ